MSPAGSQYLTALSSRMATRRRMAASSPSYRTSGWMSARRDSPRRSARGWNSETVSEMVALRGEAHFDIAHPFVDIVPS